LIFLLQFAAPNTEEDMRYLLMSLLVLSISTVASARILHVPAEFGTIQIGIDSAQVGDTVLVASGTYFEHDTLRGRDITLTSNFIFSHDEGDIANTIIDGSSSYGNAIFANRNQTVEMVIMGLTIQNCHSSGIRCYELGITIQNNIIRNNSSFGSGGGIYCYQGSTILIKSNVITGNIAEQVDGGGICCDHVDTSIIYSNVFSNNRANALNGGGIFCGYNYASIHHNLLIYNYAKC
jgi:predicted outer membrane repeat protein